MFGYILPDKPNLYMKDYALYRAFYCGLCHQIGRCQGQCMRMSVNYDVTFLSILLHGLAKEELPMEMRACVLNPFRKKSVVGETPLLKTMAYLNTLLVDFKCRDDIADGGKRGKKHLRRLIGLRVRSARKALPEVAKVLDQAFEAQCEVEAGAPTSWHMAAEPFANAIQDIIRLLTADLYTPELGMIGYLLGQYVYVLDAVDDYDKDKKKGQYNPLVLRYCEQDKRALIQAHGQEIDAEVEHLLLMVKENYQRVAIFSTEGIVTNTLWMGLRARYNQVKEMEKCQKLHTKF